MKHWKGILAIIVSLGLALALVPLSITGANGMVTVGIDAPDEVTEGSDFVADVTVDYVENFNSCGFDVIYDETIITVTNVTGGEIDGHTIGLGSGDWSYIPPGPDPGKIRVIAQMGGVPGPGITGTGYIAQIHYHVLGSHGQTSVIHLERVAMYDYQAQEITTATMDDSVYVVALEITTTGLPAGKVGDVYSATLEATDGKMPYTWTATGLPAGLTCSAAGVISGTPVEEVGKFNVTVTVTDALTNSDSKDLNLKISCKHGDVNMDGAVDTGDITKVKRIYFELDPPTPCADINGDESIDTGDITAIKLIYFGISTWSRVSTPSEEGWVLAPESYIVDYAVGDSGDVAYAIVYVYDDGYYLLKSTDSAATWQDITEGVKNEIDKKQLGSLVQLLAVACDAEVPDFVAVALSLNISSNAYVFISDDGGTIFRNAGEVKIPTDDVFAFEVSPMADGIHDIAIGGTNGTKALLFRTTATGTTAGAWEDATKYIGWNDKGQSTNFTSTAVVDIQFSPNWKTDKVILAATANSTAVQLQSGTWGENPAWNKASSLSINAVPVIGNVIIADLGRFTAGITLPTDYYSDKKATNRYAWVWVNYWNDNTPVGRVFRVKDTSVKAIGQQVEDSKFFLTDVSYWGTIAEGKAIAGVLGDGTGGNATCCEGVRVYHNDNIHSMDICCVPWEEACKPPTGRFAMEAFYVSDTKEYAVALGPENSYYDEGAWSVSFDDGDIWNQLSLVDTHIDYLSDVAVSPDCNKMMLVSVNAESGCGCDSVWLKAENLPEAWEYSGQWLRTWCGQLENNYGLLRLAAEETAGDNVFLVNRMTDNIYLNDMESFGCWTTVAAPTVDHIVDLAVKNKDTIYALDASGDVAMYNSEGWYDSVDSKVDYGWTIAVHGSNILVGGYNGMVSYSDDGGETFTLLEDTPTIEGYVTVAFDSYFDSNNTIYAAVASFDENGETTGGIYRWVIGESNEWKDLGCEPSTFQLTGQGNTTDSNKVTFTGLVLDRPAPANPMTSPDTGGVLYASYIFAKETTSGNATITSGVARCLTPAEDVCCGSTSWDYLIGGLTTDNATVDSEDVNFFEQLFVMWPEALKICGGLTADSNSKLLAIGAYPPAIMWQGADGYDMKKAEIGTVWSLEDLSAKSAARY
ncbi:MAG: putative Ig domain-containing protein [Dehalococcoidia bacterium]